MTRHRLMCGSKGRFRDSVVGTVTRLRWVGFQMNFDSVPGSNRSSFFHSLPKVQTSFGVHKTVLTIGSGRYLLPA